MEVIKGLKASLGSDQLLLFPAGPLNSREEMSSNNRLKVLELLKTCRLDGLVTLQFWDSEKWFETVLLNEINCPVVPLLRSYPSCPGITVPYEQGSYDAVKHLIEEHGCRKPVYLIGSASSSLALNERYKGFMRALLEYDIIPDENTLISQKGSFSTGSLISGVMHQGNEAVETLFGDGKLIPGKDIDSLVIFNDRMAMEVIDSLKKRGIAVPRDLKVISHDNISESETAEVPLSTSAIPWSGLGEQALVMLRNRKEFSHQGMNIPPELIIRRSCGCPKAVDFLLDEDFDSLPGKEKQEIYHRISSDYSVIDAKRKEAVEASRTNSIFRNASMLLSHCEDLESLVDTLCRLLFYLNLDVCSFFVAEDHERRKYREVLKWRGAQRIGTDDDPLYNLEDLQSLMINETIPVFESVDYGGIHLGFLAFSITGAWCSCLDDLRDLTGSVLYSLSLKEKLKAAQDQIIQDEKFSSMGILVSGVAHEINTPLGIGITASSHLESVADTLKDKMLQGELTETFFLEQMDYVQEASEIILKNLERAGELISNFKNISSNNMNDSVGKFQLKSLLEDIELYMKPLFRTNKMEIGIICPEDVVLESLPGILTQVLTNLVMNSMTHGLIPESEGKITMRVTPAESGTVILTYEDDGKGMDEEVLKNIFEPFYTTRRNKGNSGLGMFIVYNLVTRRLKGKISVSSSPGKGIRVELVLPVSLAEESG